MKGRPRTRARGITLAVAIALCSSAPSLAAYSFQKAITIDRSKISDASCAPTLTSFPMLFSVTDPDLAHTGSGGDVTDLGGDDIIFVGLDAETCGGPSSCTLDHEIERYDNTTGELVAWVRIPVVHTSAAVANTVIYIRYGDASVTSPTENPNGVWDAGFKGVWHLKETGSGAAGEFVDSSGTGNHGQGGSSDPTRTPARTTGGRIGDAQDFDGVDDFVDLGNSATLRPLSVTVSAWARREGSGDVQAWQDIVGSQDFTTGGYLLVLTPEGTGIRWRVHSSGTFDTIDGAVAATSDWHLYTGTFTGTTMRLYVDGVLQGTDPTAAMDPSTKSVAIGDDAVANANGWFDGLIDEVRISDTARSACWIEADYESQFDPGDVGAPGFYTLGVATATTWNPPTFTTAGTGDGRILWDGGPDDAGYAVVVQDDGKILVAGYSQQANYDFALWRYNADGTPDVSFGGGDGIVFTDFSGVTDDAHAVALQADGKIVVAGKSNDDFAVARYNGDGSLDTSFDTDGMVTTDLFGGVDVCQGVAIQPDGKIVLSGYAENGPGGGRDWALVRYDTDGSLDLSFGGLGTGIATADFSGGSTDTGQTVLLQPDGKIVMGGRGPTLIPGGGSGVFTVARFNTDGTLDTSFASPNGYVSADIGAAQDIAFGIALQSDGKIVEAGYRNDVKDFAVARWNSDGTPDTTFDGDGVAETDLGFLDYGRTVTVQGDGKLLVTGQVRDGAGDNDFAAVRYNTDGSLDLSFGGGDGIVIDTVGALDDAPLAATVQPDGKILIVGRAAGAGNDLQILRYDSDGTLLDIELDGATTLDGAPTFTEGGPGVVLDADVDVRDADLDALNGGSGNYDGADLVLERLGGPNAEDVFDFVDGNGITRIGTSLFKGGSAIATFIDLVPGRLTMSFVSSGQIPTSADVDNILRQITYSNSSASPPASVQIDWTFSDDVDLETTGSTTVTISGVYDFRKLVTIDRGQISDASCGATLANFPMLFHSVDPDLRHTSFGGDVTDLGGDDIIFQAFDATTCGGPTDCTLDHEIEEYDNTTGELVAWVRLPSVNTVAAASDTAIYLTYGNNQVTSPTENPTGVWDAGYQGVWHLGEGDSTAADFYQDSTINNEDGTLTDANGDSTAVAGQIGGAYDFSGDADQIDIPNFSQYLTTAMTISGWVRPPAPHADHDGYFGIRNGDVDHSFYALQLANTSDLELRFRNSVGGVYEASVASAVSAGAWVHVALTYDGSDLISYVDGQFANQDPTATGSFSSSAHTFSIGAVGGNPLDGTVDEVRVSNTARSACWIGASYNNQAWPDKAVTPSPDPTPNPSEGFYGVGTATAVELVSFTARGLDGAVELFWETGAEMDNLGFHLYRSSSASGPWERVTASAIPGLGSSPEGARYSYRDTGLTNGVTYFYVLEDIETTGLKASHGPVAATPTSVVTEDGEDAVEDERPSPSAITYGDPEANRLQVVQRGHYRVVLELTTEGFLAYPEPDGSVRIEIADFHEADGDGLPVKQTWVEAIAGRRVELVSVREQEVESIGLRPSDASEEEVVAFGSGVVELRGKRGSSGKRERRRKRAQASDAARLVELAFQGEVKKALVEMTPLRWDPSRQEIRMAKKLTVTLSFRKRDPDERVGPDGRRGRRELVRDRRKKQDGRTVVARLATTAPGLYAVRYEDLFSARSRRGVDASWLRLSRLGETVAFHLEPSTSRFAPGSLLYFVSEGADANPYGNEAVFELEYGVSGGAVMATSDATPTSSDTSASWYMRRDEHEENSLYQATLEDSRDLWMWELLFAPVKNGYPFSVTELNEGAEPGRLELSLYGGSDFPESPDHHVAVYVNGTLLAERAWDGKLGRTLDLPLWPGVLREGENLLEVENLGDTGAAYSIVYLDRYAVTYPRRTATENGVLEGRWTTTGTAEVAGVSSGALVDTTASEPVWLTGESTDQGLRFEAETEHSYLVVDAGLAHHPAVRKVSSSGAHWSSSAHQADYVVIGPSEFLEAARPLLDHRAGQGLSALAVPIENVYNEFGFGESRPEAIRELLTYAYHHWTAPSPRYVLLLGDATFDFKDNYGTGVENRVPPLMLKTRFLWTVSDPTYAAVNGDDLLPDLAIGRLPASSVDEVRRLVQKILAYETGDASLEAPVVLVSDNPDPAGDFPADAEELAATVLAGRPTEHISLAKLGTASTRQAIARAFDEGASVLSYVGHGGIHLWADENLLDISKVSTLSPQPQQPLLLTMNCLNGYFHFPFFNSLSEELVKAEGKGAIAAFSPSGMSLNGPAHLYHRALLRELLDGGHARLGDAVLAAQESYAETGAFPELLSIYQLLGDPALVLR